MNYLGIINLNEMLNLFKVRCFFICWFDFLYENLVIFVNRFYFVIGCFFVI